MRVEAASASSQRAMGSDEITSQLVAHAQRMTLSAGSSSSGGEQGPAAAAHFRVLLSWWEADNWCMLVEKGNAPQVTG